METSMPGSWHGKRVSGPLFVGAAEDADAQFAARPGAREKTQLFLGPCTSNVGHLVQLLRDQDPMTALCLDDRDKLDTVEPFSGDQNCWPCRAGWPPPYFPGWSDHMTCPNTTKCLMRTRLAEGPAARGLTPMGGQHPPAEAQAPLPSATTSSALLRGCPGRERAAAGGASWPRDVVVVPAVYKEWDSSIPAWACPGSEARYAVAPLYQRLSSTEPRFVPNFSYEAGIYLRFVVDHYHNLPPITVFVQGDAGNIREPSLTTRLDSLSVAGMRRAGVGYLPLNADFKGNKSLVAWYRREYGQEVADCWGQVLRWFGRAAWFPNIAKGEASVSFYCCNYFAVSRENILRTPLDTWKLVYDRLVDRGSCLGLRNPDRDRSLHNGAGAFESLAPLIWGDSGLTTPPSWYHGPTWSQLWERGQLAAPLGT